MPHTHGRAWRHGPALTVLQKTHAEGKLAGIRAERHYKNHDFVESRKIPDLKSKLDTFKVPYTLCV